jgi:hypothetical protein
MPKITRKRNSYLIQKCVDLRRKKKKTEQGMVVHVYNPSIQEAESG